MKKRKIKLEKLKVSSFRVPIDIDTSNTIKAGLKAVEETKDTPYGCTVTVWFSNCYRCRPSETFCFPKPTELE